MASLILVFLLAFGAAQGLLLLLYFLNKRQKRTAFTFLMLILGTVLLQLLAKILSKTWLMDHGLLVYKLSYQLPLIIGPLLWFYVKATLQEKMRFRWQDGIHLVPFIISAIAILNDLFFPQQDIALTFVLSQSVGHTFDLGIQLCTVGFYTWFSFQTAQNQHLKQFILITGFLQLFIAIAYKLLYVTYPLYIEWRWLFLIVTFYIYWVTYQLLQHGFDFNKKAVSNEKYANSGLKLTDTHSLTSRLQQLMQEQKPYLESTFNIEQLAKQMGISRHHLSQVLNEGLQKTYHDFVNEYRVEAAKKMLLDSNKQHYSIAAIAFEVGFNSLSSFNLVFKKHCGSTPSEYRKQSFPLLGTISNASS